MSAEELAAIHAGRPAAADPTPAPVVPQPVPAAVSGTTRPPPSPGGPVSTRFQRLDTGDGLWKQDDVLVWRPPTSR